jgi:hypothetical protein
LGRRTSRLLQKRAFSKQIWVLRAFQATAPAHTDIDLVEQRIVRGLLDA